MIREEEVELAAMEQYRPTDKGSKQYLDLSRDRLKTNCLKKVDTTMIGSLDIIEKEIQDLSRKLAPEDVLAVREAFSRMRSKILDNGNNQKRAMTEEFKHYTIQWNMYTMTMQVKDRNDGSHRPMDPSYDTFVIVPKEGK